MHWRLIALGLGVLFIAISTGYYWGHELLIWLKPFFEVIKVAWSKFITSVLSESWILILPFFKRWIFVEIPKRVVIFLAFCGIVSKGYRHKLRKFTASVKHHVITCWKVLVRKTYQLFGKRTKVVVLLIVSTLIFVSFFLLFHEYLLIWLGTISWFFRPIGAAFRFIWHGFVGRTIQGWCIRFVTFLGLNHVTGRIIQRYVSLGIRKKASAIRLRFVRREIKRRGQRHDQMTQTLSQIRSKYWERLKLLIAVYKNLWTAKKKDLKELHGEPPKSE